MVAPIRIEIELADGSFTTGMLRAGQSVRELKREVEAANPALSNFGNGFAGLASANSQLGQFQRSMLRLNPALANIKNTSLGVVQGLRAIDTQSKGVLATFRDLAIIVGIVSVGFGKLSDLVQRGWLGDIIKINSQMELLNYQMQAMSSSADPVQDAADAVAYLRKMSLQAPMALSTLTNGFVKLKATGTDPLNGSMQALADGIAAASSVGGMDEAFNRSVLAISQMSGKGVIQMEELRQQLGESMPRAVELMARSMGISMAQLIKDISTGTVQAQQSLQLLYAELNRTYGGRAQFMMQTFEGQLRRVQTSFQMLADDGGEPFFESVKEQLVDLGDLLGTQQAKDFAATLGNGAAFVVEKLRELIDWLVDFREEIGRISMLAGALLGGAIMGKGLAAATQSWQLLTIAVSNTGIAFARAGAQANIAHIALNSGAGFSGLVGAAGNAARAVGSLAAGIAGIMPWVAGIGFAVYTAGEYFGVFANKVNDAYMALRQYGAESREQASRTIDARLAQLQEQAAAFERLGVRPDDSRRGNILRSTLAEIDAIKRERDALIGEAGEREDAKSKMKLQRQLEDRRTVLQGAYDRESRQLMEHYDALEAEARNANRSTEQIEDDRAAALKARRQKYYDDQILMLRKQLAIEEDAQRIAQKNADSDAQKAIQQRIAMLDGMLRDVMGAKYDESRTGTGAPKLAKVINDEEAFKKGEAALARINAEIDGLKAGINGANAEAAELQVLLQNGKYGDADTEQVKKLNEALVAATRQKELLDELFKSKDKLQTEIDNLRIKQVEEEMELRAKLSGNQLDDVERLQIKVQQGFFPGFGGAAGQAGPFAGMLDSFSTGANQAGILADTIQTDTFGTTSVGRINAVTEAIVQTAQAVGMLDGGLQGLDWSRLGVGSVMPQNVGPELEAKIKQAMASLMAKGWSQVAASGIVGNLMGESGLDPTAYNPDDLGKPSGGLAQHRAERLEQLKQFAADLGKHWTDFETQIAFIDYELRTTYAAAGSKLRMAGTPAAASEIFLREFERPQDPNGQSPIRAGNADKAMQLGPGGMASNSYIAGAVTSNQLLDERVAKERDLVKLRQELARFDYNENLLESQRTELANVDDLNKNYAKLKAIIESKANPFGTSNDVNDPQYAELVANARELDRVTEEMNQKKDARNKLDSLSENFLAKQLEFTQRIAEANSRVMDPLERQSSAGFRSLRRELDAFITQTRDYYGADSAEYAAALEQKKALLSNFRSTEIIEMAAGWAEENEEMKRSLQSQTQARQAALAEEIALIDRAVAAFVGSEEDKLRVVQAAEERKRLLRQQFNDEVSPFGKQMQEWGDLANNLADASTRWMDSLASGITDLLIEGKSLGDTLKGVAKDTANIALKWAFSSMTGGFGGTPKTGTPKVAHTGGMVGSSGMATRSGVDMSAFIGAPRFHTGGIIGSDEVPIIAKKGEGVFTPEQMEAIGGFSSSMAMNVQAPITINGSAGSAEQNQDLADRMAKSLHDTVRSIAAKEMQNAMRPGGALNQRSR